MAATLDPRIALKRWVPTGPVPMGYHPAMAAYVQKTTGIQAGSVVFLGNDANTSGQKRRRDDAVCISAENAATKKFAFAIDDIHADDDGKRGDCVSLQTYGLVSAFVQGDVKVGMPVYPYTISTGEIHEKLDYNPQHVHLTVDHKRGGIQVNGAANGTAQTGHEANYAGYIVAVESAEEVNGFRVCRIFVNTCRTHAA